MWRLAPDRLLFGLVLLLAGLALGPLTAEEVGPPAPTPKPTKPGSDELLLFQDLPEVVSASRKPESITASSAPVSVVSAEDIHYSGLQRIPEILQFVPGMDVLRVDRNRYAVGVRGLHDVFSDRTLTLIDGRNAESPIFGGSEFTRYPVFMEDIDRIEVVRGPGGAAWGANAFNGVINVISKKPKDTQGFLGTDTTDQNGDTYSQLRWGASKGAWAWRTSYGYTQEKSSAEAIPNQNFKSNDWNKEGAFDGVATRDLGDKTVFSMGLGYQYQRQGDFEFLGYEPGGMGLLSTTRAFARIDHEFNAHLSGYMQWFGNFAYTDQPSLQRSTTAQNDFEAQVNYEPFDGHKLTLGMNVRRMDIDLHNYDPSQVDFPTAPQTEYFAGLFGIYRWEANKRVTLEAQLRGDDYSETQTDWASRASVLFAATEDHRHNLRFSVAKSFRTPYIGLRDLDVVRPPQAGLSPIPFFVSPNHDLKNEEMWSYEIGYTGRLADGITLRADGYAQRMNQLAGAVTSVMRVPPIPFATTQIFNIDGAKAYGGEIELIVQRKMGRLSAWYGYNGFYTDRTNQPVRALPPAANKFGLTGRLYLPHEVTLNLNYKHTDRNIGDSGNFNTSVAPSNRLDFTVSKSFDKGRFELMTGVTDILNDTDTSVRPIGAITSHDTPGRTFFARFQFKF